MAAARMRGTTLAILHGAGDVGGQWKDFISKMFTEELPEECRDMNLDVIAESVTNLGEDDVCNINNCEYKLLLLDAEVLDVIKKDDSTIRQVELLETQPEQLIVLIIGDQDNVEFLQSANATLYGIKGHEAFSIIQAKYPDQIFSDVMTILSPMHVVPHPNILSSEEKDQHLTLISNKPYPVGQEVEYVIEFSVGRKTKEMAASLFNPCTLLVQNPGHPPGVVTVKILACTRNPHTDGNAPEVTRTQIGDDLKVWFQSDLDRVYSVLESQTNPMQFLCQAMNIANRREDANRTVEEKVDKLLTESFKRCVPDNKLHVFSDIQGWDEHEQDGNRTEYLPTLLHFSALYGLRDLTAALLQCPGAVQAYGTANCEGDYPTNLAEKSGHWDLRDFMETYMEVAAMVDRDFGNEGSMQTSQLMSDMVQGQYLSFGEDMSISEDIYCRMDDCRDTTDSLSLPPGYLPMKSLVDPSLKSVDYDSMIEKMLQQPLIEDNEKEYESMDFIQPPPPILPRQIHEERIQEEAPPPPPPRDDKYASAPPREDGPAGQAPEDSLLMLPKMPTNLSSAQEELIALQKKVKNKELTINQAVFRFKEWERKHKERAASFQYQQESLQRIRNSLMRSRARRKQEGRSTSIKISDPLMVATSTYDKVLLKTRKEVMVENAYGGFEKNEPEKRDGAKTPSENFPPGNAYTPEAQGFARTTSFKNRSFGRPPMSLPGEWQGSTRSRSSIGSQASTNSSSSRSSNRSIGGGFPSSFDRTDIPPPLPPLPGGRDLVTSRMSIPNDVYRTLPNRRSEFPIDPYSRDSPSDHYRPFGQEGEAPPPVPPRDDASGRFTMRHHSIAGTLDARPDVPPRNPYSRFR